jgi:hypothetical protein
MIFLIDFSDILNDQAVVVYPPMAMWLVLCDGHGRQEVV